MSPRLALIGGGARSGKSRFAQAEAMARGRRRVYVATAEAGDDDMRARIARHAAERGDDFRTVEAPIELARALASIDDADVVVVDCLTLWISNLCCADLGADAIEARVDAVARILSARARDYLVVTNEVGLGVVPDNALARHYRDVMGRAHQRLAAEADEVYLGAMGVMLRLAPAPVIAVVPEQPGAAT